MQEVTKLPKSLPKWLCNFAFTPAICESSCCSTSFPAFGVVSVLDFGHSNIYVMVTHYCFTLKFPKDMMWSNFHIHILPYVYFLWRGVCSGFGPYFNQVFCFLILVLNLHILWTTVVCFFKIRCAFANIFSQSVVYLLILLNFYFIFQILYY